MKLFRRKFLKLGNKGLSMVELICGITILAIIGTSISSMLIVSANTYDRGSAEAEVQQEAQLVANQISDLLIDATADVSYDSTNNVLTVRQADKLYTVTYKSTEQKVYYQEGTYDAVTGALTNSEAQLMAEGVESFSIDISDFQERGYARLDMEFKNDERTYPAVFTITARNKEVSEATEVVAKIVLPSELYVEPTQVFELKPTVYGLANPDVDWEIVGAKPTTAVVAENGNDVSIKVGTDEDANMFRVRAYVKQGGVVKAETYVNMYVRRVNEVVIGLQSQIGADGMTNTRYNLKAEPVGTNLVESGSHEYGDYKSPYNMEWVVTSNAANVPYRFEYSGVAGEASLVLEGPMIAGVPIEVTAKAKHPDGDNKTGNDYGDAVGTYVITLPSYVTPTNGGIERGTDSPQGVANLDAMKNAMIALYGNGNWVKRDFYCYVKVDDDGNQIGSWTDWIESKGDQGHMMNVRPAASLAMEFYSKYNVKVVTTMWKDGVMYYPAGGQIETLANTVGGTVEKVQPVYSSTVFGIGSEGATGGTAANAIIAPANDGDTTDVQLLDYVDCIACKDDVIRDDIFFKIYKQDGDSWTLIDDGASGEQGAEVEIIQSGAFVKAKVKGTASGNYKMVAYCKPDQYNHKFVDGLDVYDGVIDEGVDDNIYLNYGETGEEVPEVGLFDERGTDDTSDDVGIFYFTVE